MVLVSRSLRFIFRRVSPFRFVGPGLTLAGLLALSVLAITGRIDLSSLDLLDGDSPLAARGASSDLQPVRLDPDQPRPDNRIRIATFNIERFGEKKSGDAEVMGYLARIVAHFDLVAIQEVQSPQAMPVARLVDLINRSGGRYDASVSEPIGRSTYREQYAFVWDTTRVRMIPDSAYVVQDDLDRMSRQPMVASFETRIMPVASRQPFRFTVINVHTAPDAVSEDSKSNEMDVLGDVFIRVREYEYQVRGIVNVLLAGDLNVPSDQLGGLGRIPGVISVVGDTPTNTRQTQTYDHLVIDSRVTTEYTGMFGVFDFEREFGISREQALRISDHLPVWAEFSAYEMPPEATASRQAATVR